MIHFSSLTIIFFLVTLIAATRRNWSIYFVIASVPLFGVIVFQGIGHQFRVPELAIFSLGLNQMLRSFRSGHILLPRHPSLLSLGGFFVIAVVSVISVAIRPATVLTHPYNSGLDGFHLVPLVVSSTNITQLLLRLFTVLSIYLLAINLTSRSLRLTIRGLVYGGLITGIIGVIYQAFVLVDVTWFSEGLFRLLQKQGLEQPPSVGPIPMMYTLVGEPGHTAQFLLYTLALLVGFAISKSDSHIFRKNEIKILLPVTVIFIILTTSSTAYGGLGILAAVSLLGAFLSDKISATKHAASVAASVLVTLTIISPFLVNGEFISYLTFQLEKLQFSAGSGIIRFQYLQLSVDLMQTRPFFGIGTGSYYSTSLAGTIIVETGLLGFGAFVGANLLAYRSAAGYLNTDDGAMVALGMALFIGGLTHFLTSLLAKSITTLLTPWFWLSLALPIAMVRCRNWQVSPESNTESDGLGESPNTLPADT